jgi:hypothetical protein
VLGLYLCVGLGKRHLSLRERSVRYEPGEGVRKLGTGKPLLNLQR